MIQYEKDENTIPLPRAPAGVCYDAGAAAKEGLHLLKERKCYLEHFRSFVPSVGCLIVILCVLRLLPYEHCRFADGFTKHKKGGGT